MKIKKTLTGMLVPKDYHLHLCVLVLMRLNPQVLFFFFLLSTTNFFLQIIQGPMVPPTITDTTPATATAGTRNVFAFRVPGKLISTRRELLPPVMISIFGSTSISFPLYFAIHFPILVKSSFTISITKCYDSLSLPPLHFISIDYTFPIL